jgi:hypothetical protein
LSFVTKPDEGIFATPFSECVYAQAMPVDPKTVPRDPDILEKM